MQFVLSSSPSPSHAGLYMRVSSVCSIFHGTGHEEI